MKCVQKIEASFFFAKGDPLKKEGYGTKSVRGSSRDLEDWDSLLVDLLAMETILSEPSWLLTPNMG